MVNSVVIVLGAATTKEATATPCLRRRTESGCRYVQEIEDADLLVCGGQTNSHHFVPEAEVMAKLVADNNVPADKVYLEKQSRNTLENAIFAKRMIADNGWDNLYVVTDRTHMFRAKMVFKTMKLKATFLPVHETPNFSGKMVAALYEIPALLWYGVRILNGHHKQYKGTEK